MLTIVGIPFQINHNEALLELWRKLMASVPSQSEVYNLYANLLPPGKDFDEELKRLNIQVDGAQKELLDAFPKIMDACKLALQSLAEVHAKPTDIIVNHNQLFANGKRGAMAWSGASFSIV